MNIKEMIYKEDKTKKKVEFLRYFDGALHYKTECGFEFPVPVSDIGTATFNAIEDAPLLMRYIRKQISLVEGNVS